MKWKVSLLLVCLTLFSISAEALPKTVRGIWASRWMITTPEEVSTLVKTAKENHFNVIFFQVRGDGETLYHSKIEPRSEVLSKAPADWDPLSDVLKQAHAAGIEVHAWVNCYSVWNRKTTPTDPQHLVNLHPDWILCHPDGKVLQSGESEGIFADPGNPKMRQYLASIVKEIITNYPVDGIQLDYIRYPGANFCYCNSCLTQFKSYLQKQLPASESASLCDTDPQTLPGKYPTNWDQWKRDQVTEQVRLIRKTIRASKPKVRLSICGIVWGSWKPFPKTDAYSRVFQDWHGWMQSHLVDFVCPMAYATKTDKVVDFVSDAVKNGDNCPVVAGLGSYLNPPDETCQQVNAMDKIGARGVSIFAYGEMTSNEGTSEDLLKGLQETTLWKK